MVEINGYPPKRDTAAHEVNQVAQISRAKDTGANDGRNPIGGKPTERLASFT